MDKHPDRPAGNRFDRRKERTRSQLKQAAIALILEKGYDNITIQDITDRADLGRATFYLYYKDKEAIVWDTLVEEFLALDRRLNQDFPPGQTFDEYPGYLSALQQAAAHRDLYRIMFGSQGSAALIRRVEGFFAEEVEREIRQRSALKDLPDLPPAFVSQFIVGALVRVIVWWLEQPTDYTPEQLATMFYQMVHHRAH